MQRSASINLILFFCLALLWSGSFINIKIAVEALPPLFSAMMRVLISLVSLTFLFWVMGRKAWVSPREGWRLWMAGVFAQALPFAFLFVGEKYISPALASIINSTVAIWALLIGTLVFRDFTQWTIAKVIGILLGFFGILLIFLPYLHDKNSSLLGVIFIMAMSICYAIGGLINQHVIFKKMTVTFEANLVQQHVFSLFVLLASSALFEPWPTLSAVLNMQVFPSLLYLGVMATAIAWVIYFYLTREWGMVRVSSVMYIVPVLAILWDLLFLHLIPTRDELIGAGAILAGVLLIQWQRMPAIEASLEKA